MVLYYDIQGIVKQVNKFQYSFGAWNELISFTLFVMGKYDSVFEQIVFRTAFQNESCSKTEV